MMTGICFGEKLRASSVIPKEKTDLDQKQIWKNLYRQQKRQLDPWAYQDNQFLIRPVREPEELEREQKQMHQTQGPSIQEMATGDVRLFLIRSIKRPDMPMYTVEIWQDRRIRAYGMGHTDIPEETKRFLEKWLKQKETTL